MAPPSVRQRPIHSAIGTAVAGYIGLVERTSRPPPLMDQYAATLLANHPMIIAMWHGQFMLLPTLAASVGIPTKAMLALHQDAEGLAYALRRYGIELIRGAGASAKGKDRGGAHAFRGAVQALESGFSVAMTADVPPGPARRAGHGIVTLAKVSGRPIVPVAMASSRYVALPTWSRVTINLPGSQLGASFGTPIHVPADASPELLETLRRRVEEQMNIATVDAYIRAGTSHVRATPASALTAAGERTAAGAKLKLYVWGARLLGHVAPLFLAARERRGKEDGARRPERFGKATQARPPGQLAWLHAASVGETMSVLPLIDAMRANRPDLSILLTTGTVTSAKLAATRLPDNCIHQFVPLDVPAFVRRFLDYWRPDLGVFVESEIWPNLILQSARQGFPLALINARMSKTSFRRWRGQASISRPLFCRFALVLAQSREYAERFTALGAPEVRDIGNLKFDAPPLPADAAALAAYRATLGGRSVFLAASTHADEEVIIAEAHMLLRAKRPDLATIIVPRHPERGPDIAARLRAAGVAAQLRSEMTTVNFAEGDVGSGVLIADTLGELGTWFALAPIAYIGKSLSSDGGGGHNPIEAVRHGAAVLTGPRWVNFDEAYKALLAARGAREVKNSTEIAVEVERLLDDPAAAEAMRAAATLVCDKLAGAMPKTVTALLALLPPLQPVGDSYEKHEAAHSGQPAAHPAARTAAG